MRWWWRHREIERDRNKDKETDTQRYRETERQQYEDIEDGTPRPGGEIWGQGMKDHV